VTGKGNKPTNVEVLRFKIGEGLEKFWKTPSRRIGLPGPHEFNGDVREGIVKNL